MPSAMMRTEKTAALSAIGRLAGAEMTYACFLVEVSAFGIVFEIVCCQVECVCLPRGE